MAGATTDSRYALIQAYRLTTTGETFWSTRLPVSLDRASDDRWVRPLAGERLDQLAYRVWGGALGPRATRLWWLIADLNDIVNPFAALDPARSYRVLSADRLALEVLG